MLNDLRGFKQEEEEADEYSDDGDYDGDDDNSWKVNVTRSLKIDKALRADSEDKSRFEVPPSSVWEQSSEAAETCWTRSTKMLPRSSSSGCASERSW
jgi:hypothetical protein